MLDLTTVSDHPITDMAGQALVDLQAAVAALLGLDD